MAKTDKQKIGDWGEAQASIFLQQKGYEITDRNYRVKNGEIDIVAWQNKPYYGRTLCFIEVKTRSDWDGSAERATKDKKLPQLFSASRHYCLTKNINIDKTPIQFEQVSVQMMREFELGEIKHFVIIVE